MKKSKKILAALIAVIIAFSVMPVALAAEECEHSFQNIVGERPNISVDGYCYCSMCGVRSADYSGIVDAFAGAYTIVYSVYNPGERAIFSEFIHNFSNALYGDPEEVDFDIVIHATEEDQSFVDERAALANKVVEEYKEKSSGVVYDAAEVGRKTVLVEFQVQWAGGEKAFFGDYLSVVKDAFNDYEAFVEKVETGVIAPDYEVCSAEADKLIACLDRQIACLSGNHTFGEYTDNGDGTSTAKCEYCTTTDTVEVEKKDIIDIVSTDLVELIKMLFTLVKSFIETVFA